MNANTPIPCGACRTPLNDCLMPVVDRNVWIGWAWAPNGARTVAGVPTNHPVSTGTFGFMSSDEGYLELGAWVIDR